MMDYVFVIGMVAAVCVTLSALPQFIKSWKTKKTHDISLGMYVTLSIGLFLWLVYGWLREDIPLILTNFISLIFVVSILYLKLRYG